MKADQIYEALKTLEELVGKIDGACLAIESDHIGFSCLCIDTEFTIKNGSDLLKLVNALVIVEKFKNY